MVMRVRNNLRCAGPIISGGTDYRGRIRADTSSYASAANFGSFQSIDSVYDGGFQPNILRLNPVTITRGFGSCTTGQLVSKGSNTAFAKAEEHVEGPFMATQIDALAIGAWNSTMESRSASACYNKLNSADAEVGLMLVDLGRTLNLLRNPLKELVDLLKHLRAPRKRNSAAVGDFLANTWLGTKYGILPLVKDIDDLRKYFHKQVDEHAGQLCRRRATKKQETETSSYTTGGYGFFSFPLVRTTKTTVKSTTVVYFQRVWEAEARMRSKALGLDLSQLPRIMWDMVPLSFVADWFGNFGEWLSAISPSSHASFRGSCTSQKITIETVLTHGEVSPSGLYGPQMRMSRTVSSTYSGRTETLIRKVGTTTPVMPVFKPGNLDFQKALTSLSLIWQRCPHKWRMR